MSDQKTNESSLNITSLFKKNHFFKKTACIILIGITLLFTTSSFTNAQEVYNFKNLTSKNGLPSNEVYDIYQDVNGLIWFATDRGLCNYNGYTFTNLGLKDGLTSTAIFKFHLQPNGDIWCTTANNRLFYFNPKDYVIHKYSYNDILEELSESRLSEDLLIDKNGTLHLSFIDFRGVISIDSKGKVIRKACIQRPCCPPNIFIVTDKERSFSYISMEKIEIIQSSKVFQFEKSDFNPRYHKTIQRDSIQLISDYTTVYYLINNKLHSSITTDKVPIGLGFIDEHHFWVGYRYGGVAIYDLNGNQVERYLDQESVSDICTDHEKGIWIATVSHGVFYIEDFSFSHFLIDDYIHQLSIHKDNTLLVSAQNGNIYKETKDGFDLLKTSKSKSPKFCQSYTHVDGTIFFNVMDKSYIEIENKDKENQTFQTVYIKNFSDERDSIPMLAARSRFYVMTSPKGITEYRTNGFVNDLCAANNGAYLAKHMGLFYYNFTSKKEQKLSAKSLDYRINDVDCFSHNRTLAATSGNGVVIIEENGTWAIREKHGLTGDIVSEVYVQNDSVFWVCTNTGLNRIKIDKNRSFDVSTITMEDGLIDNFTTDIAIIDSTVWIATRYGLSSFTLDKLNQKTDISNSFLRITNIRVNDKKKRFLTDLEHWQNTIEINFEGISFKENLKYRYKLVGLDNKWRYTSNTKVTYEALPSGDYTFILQAGAKDTWNELLVKSTIVIHPPFYKTIWFVLTCIFILSLLIYLFFKYRILSYNKDISREIMRQVLKRLKKKTMVFIVEIDGKKTKIKSREVLYVQSSRNYIEIYTENRKFLIREKISNFLDLVPDSIEYIRVNRSYIVRIDKVTSKSKNSLWIGKTEIKVGNTYQETLSQIHL